MEFHEAASIFPMMGADEYQALVSDIRENGQREPIWTYQGRIIDGRNRYNACRALGIEPQVREWSGQGSLIAFVVSLNLHRRHLSESQRALIGARIKPLFEEEARKRQLAGKRAPAESEKAPVLLSDSCGDLKANLPEGKGQSRDIAAQAVNVSPRSVESASKVIERGVPELAQAVETGKVAVSTAAVIAEAPPWEQSVIVARGEKEILEAAKEIRARKAEARRDERVEKILAATAEPAPLSELGRRFPVVYADPPWRYEHAVSVSREIENQYPTMPLDDICALPVGEVTTADCVLFLWATSPKLDEALCVIREWGFTYRTCMVWVKDRIGMGYYARQKHELLLIATKGEPPTPKPEDRPASVLEAALGEHSAKPAAFYAAIESMYPELPKIELFCRKPREGWEAWGNQVKEPPCLTP